MKTVIALVLFASAATADPPKTRPPRLALLETSELARPKVELVPPPVIETKPIKIPLLENIKITPSAIVFGTKF